MGKSTPWHYKVLWGIMADPDLQAPSKCAATVLLLKYHNHKTGQCNPSYSTVAKLLGRDRRNVINAVNDLKAGDWIEWVGTKGGSSSNTNAFKFKMKGAARSDEVITTTGDVVVTGDEKGMRGDEVVTPPVTKSSHDLSIEPSKELSSRARGPNNADAFGSLGADIAARIGPDKFQAWFRPATITDIAPDSLTLELSTQFRSDYVATNFQSVVTDCCKAIQPTIERVKIVAATARAA